LKELEDHSWFPSILRNFQTEFIGFVVVHLNLYNSFIQHLNMPRLPVQPATDLCSGSGEPAITIFRKTNCFSKLILCDKFPHAIQQDDSRIFYETKPVDVLQMEFTPGIYYTMFNAFHHFNDADKINCVQKIQRSGATAFFVEILEPRIICLLKVLFATTIGCLLLTPFIRPFSLRRLLFTYIIPVNILTITFDGIVSVLKSHTANYYKKLFAAHEKQVEITRLKGTLIPLIVIRIN
jgi:hypothetical protein